MMNYHNELLGLSRTEIRKEWDTVWAEIQKLNPIRDTEKLVELNQKFDKCVEAIYANDCGVILHPGSMGNTGLIR